MFASFNSMSNEPELTVIFLIIPVMAYIFWCIFFNLIAAAIGSRGAASWQRRLKAIFHGLTVGILVIGASWIFVVVAAFVVGLILTGLLGCDIGPIFGFLFMNVLSWLIMILGIYSSSRVARQIVRQHETPAADSESRDIKPQQTAEKH